MDTYKQFMSYLYATTGQDNIITIPKIFIETLGELNSAIFLNQVIFWTGKSKKTDDDFFYKSYDDWQEEIMLSKKQSMLCVKKLKDLNLIETKRKKVNGIPTNHYKANMDEIIKLLGKNQKGTSESDQKELSMESDQKELPKVTKGNQDLLTVDYLQKNTQNINAHFKEFWSIYPNRKDKQRALKSFMKCLKADSVETILLGVKKYVEETKGTDKKYIKHPTTFLNNRCYMYEDEEKENVSPGKAYKRLDPKNLFGGEDE